MTSRFPFLTVSFAFLLATFAGDLALAQGRRPPWTTSRIQGSPEPPAPFRLVEAFPGVRFDHPTSIEQLPGGPLLVTEMSGKLFSLAKNEKPKPVGDLAAMLTGELAGRGVSLFDAELHPRFAENRFLFLCYVHPGNGGETRVSRFTLNDSPLRLAEDSEEAIITWPPGGHNGGCLEFGKDGLLYISTGDGTGPNPPDGLTTGQTVSDLLGAILRIDVDRAEEGKTYSVPSDNPFAKLEGARPEVWAYGLRNPWKFGVDPQTGEIFVADNGWETWEVVHKIERGTNCGWPIMEGRAILRSEVAPGPTPITPPVKDHHHSEANSVIGGPVYRGSKLPDLAGSFVYGDYITGTIWSLAPDKDNSYSHKTLVDTDLRIVAFLEGAGGELYVLDYDLTGAIYELVPSNEKDTSASFPRKLSETGLFSSLDPLTPAAGVVAYDVQAPRWMDGAVGQRFVAIPGDGQISLATGAEPAKFPEGTVLAKQLSLPIGEGRPPTRLETQILHYEAGSWRHYSYLWDDAGQDAELAPSIGASRAIQAPDPLAPERLSERTWHVNAVNECKLCHNAESGTALGFNASQFHRLGQGELNQLFTLRSQGVVESGEGILDATRLVDPTDKSATLDDRARSYLHANCAMCHQPGGNAIVSFYLRRDLPFDKLNTNKGTGIGTFGLVDAQIIAPGQPYSSLLLYRMSKLGYARMPYIGSRVVDSGGVTLIEEWIRSMEGESGSAEKPGLESSPEALALAIDMHRGELPAERALAMAERGAAHADGNIRGLFETFLPESKRRKVLGPGALPETILALEGDRERGKLIFFSDGARCRACHEIGDKEKSLGPTLEEIAKKFPERSEMLRHVLNPSEKIEEPVAAWSVETSDGRLLSGLLVAQSDKEITLKTAEKLVVKLARDEVEALRKGDKSLMPDRILSDLTAQEAADLLEYVRSHATR
jgi:putative heme-binding domain-containing protein